MSRATLSGAVCADENLLSAYLDGELAAAEERAVEDHLAACPGCRADLAGLRSVVERLQGLQRATPPAGLGHAVARRVALEARPVGLLGRMEAALRRLVVDPGTLVLFGTVLALAVIATVFAVSVEESNGRPVAAEQGQDWTGVEVAGVVVAGRHFERDGGLWRERGAEEPERTVSAGSAEGRALLAEMPRLRGLLGNAEGITMQTDEGTILLKR
jgi:hypothetical protein